MNEIERQYVSLKGVFRRGNRFLVLKEANDLWEIPGGKLELGEQIDDCFKREMFEELGWQDCKIGKIIHIWTIISKQTKAQYIIICAIAEPKEEPIVLSDEHYEYRWLTISEIKELNIFPDFVKALERSLEI